MNDPFGLEHEKAIKKSKVREVFNPHSPINNVDLFLGRTAEVKSLISHINTPGQHALLFGDRGVGKSSLANISAHLLLKKLVRGAFIQKRCDSTDTFATVMASPLSKVGIDLDVAELSKTKAEGGKAGASLGPLGASLNTTTTSRSVQASYTDKASSPGWVAEKISKMSGLLLIDEVDALSDETDRHKLAELVKHLSDAASPLKILLVGIAETGTDLVAGHKSVQRCLKETPLSRMSDDELVQIIEKGEDEVNLEFSKKAKDRIVNVSSGFAHFTHLLALKSAENAILKKYKHISVDKVQEATQRAVSDAEGSLRASYQEASRSANTNEYANLLAAAATCRADQFSSRELREAYAGLWDRQISQGSVNNYLHKMISEDGSKILRRIAKGVYRFSDPRMPSFIRIAHMAKEKPSAASAERDG